MKIITKLVKPLREITRRFYITVKTRSRSASYIFPYLRAAALWISFLINWRRTKWATTKIIIPLKRAQNFIHFVRLLYPSRIFSFRDILIQSWENAIFAVFKLWIKISQKLKIADGYSKRTKCIKFQALSNGILTIFLAPLVLEEFLKIFVDFCYNAV